MNNMSAEEKWNEVYLKPVKKVGMITLLVAAGLTLTPLLYLYVAHGVVPPFDAAMRSWGLVAAAFGAFYIVEPVSYYAILGLAGTYMSFLSGNISNLRLPCAAMAQEVVGVTEGSQEGEIIATMGISASVIVNIIAVTLAAFVGMAVIGILPEVIVDGFRDYTAPAIFGAVYGQFSLRYLHLAPIGIGIALLFIGVFQAPAWISILFCVFGTMGIARLMYNKDILGGE